MKITDPLAKNLADLGYPSYFLYPDGTLFDMRTGKLAFPNNCGEAALIDDK